MPDIRLTDTVRNAISTIADIHGAMRWLELAHATDPRPDDLASYRQLTQKLTTALGELLTEVTKPPPDPGSPMDLAATAFPTPITDAINTAPLQAVPRPPDATPRSPHTRPAL